MSLKTADWSVDFLDGDERSLCAFESNKEMGTAQIAAAVAFGGIAGLAIGTAVASKQQRATSGPTVWVGTVVLTQRRLLLVDGLGIRQSIDRSSITSVKVAKSPAGTLRKNIIVFAHGATYRIHTSNKIAESFAQALVIGKPTQVSMERTDIEGLARAVPVIFLYLIGVFLFLVGLDELRNLIPVGLLFVAAGEGLRRLLFRNR